jgi:hypothetical protein
MRLLRFALALAVATAGFADTITLRSGRVITGTYLGGTARQVRVDTGSQVQTLDVSDIVRIDFTSDAAPVSRSSDDGRPTLRRESNVMRPDSSDDSRPTLRRDASASSSDASSSTSDDSRPTLRRGGSSSSSDASAAAPDDDRPILRRRDGSAVTPDSPATTPASAPAPAPAGTLDLPAGTSFLVRMIDGVNSEVNKVGQTFAASLDAPVTVNGVEAIPRGADVVVKLVDAKQSGTFTGHSEVTLSLASVKVNGHAVDINTQTISRESASRGKDTATRAAGVGVAGAVIGAVAGGGKGAAVGAAAGGAAGAGSEAVTKGPQVKIPSETRLTFVLDTAVRI